MLLPSKVAFGQYAFRAATQGGVCLWYNLLMHDCGNTYDNTVCPACDPARLWGRMNLVVAKHEAEMAGKRPAAALAELALNRIFPDS